MDTTQPSATVYYNSACPVCDAGICYQRAKMQGSGVRFVDVNAQPALAQELGIDLERLRERLHVRGADGKLVEGARAFVLLWSQTRGQRWLAQLARALYHWNRRRGNW